MVVMVANHFINAIIMVSWAEHLINYPVVSMVPNVVVDKLISKVSMATDLDNLLVLVFVMDFSVKLDLVYPTAIDATLVDAH